MTWWGKDGEIHWFYPDNIVEIIGFIKGKIMS
jgi:hypothetical protein